MTEEIYVALLDEGTEVWRSVPARKVADFIYLILKPADYDPDDEKWQFPPGSTVLCESRRLSHGVALTAIQQKDQGRRTA